MGLVGAYVEKPTLTPSSHCAPALSNIATWHYNIVVNNMTKILVALAMFFLSSCASISGAGSGSNSSSRVIIGKGLNF